MDISQGIPAKLGMEGLSPIDYENKWLKVWLDSKTFEADPDPSRPKLFITFPYSYQNGPLHVGHGFTASRVDAYARYKRMRGFNVLFPWAWHWTGEAVAGTSERLRRGDEAVLKMLREIDGVPEELINRFRDPKFICEYYTRENKAIVNAMGFSIDWRREFHTTDLHPYYSRFIEWQYLSLYNLGLVKRGSHPVVWCPSCQSPTGDHDRLVGEGVSPEEFTLVYFRVDEGYYLAAATLRPETIFGATNLWINPDAHYVSITLRNAEILVSKASASKLREQMEGVVINREVRGSELIGKFCEAPLTGKTLPILPAYFVDPNIGSGIVYSVPSHAPYDYAGLVELSTNKELASKYGIDPSYVAKIEPLSIISTPGLPPHPAVEAVKGAGIVNQLDERLEGLTREIYSKEFHEGVMRENCGDLSGSPVSRAREVVKWRLLEAGLGAIMYDLPERVVCRSGDECVVKIVHDQWFLKYSDSEWKEGVRRLVKSINMYPESARQWFLNVIDWLRDWPCARKTGLGTKLPFDDSWIVETLSDSTIYQALYTVSKYVNLCFIKPEQLTFEFFDYIFRGVGDVSAISKATNIPKELLEDIRREFDYWYPVDLRISAKELVPNHLTFFLFQHVALFNPDKWPRGISVNGMVQVEGEKMSKSRGNFVPLKATIAKYGADATRLTLLLSAEDMDDPDWRSKNAEEVRRALDNFLRLVSEYSSATIEDRREYVDDWLDARLNQHILDAERYMESLRTRSAANLVLYIMMKDWRRYLRRRGGRYGQAAKRFIESWIKLLMPFAPYTAEEAWSMIGGQGLVSLAPWPEVRRDGFEELTLLREELIDRLLSDARSIAEATSMRFNNIYVYVAPSWMVNVVGVILEEGVFEAASRPGRIIKRAMEIPNVDVRRLPQIIEKMAGILKEFKPRFSDESLRLAVERELETYVSAKDFLERELGCYVSISEADKAQSDPLGKAKQSLPLKPGIYVE